MPKGTAGTNWEFEGFTVMKDRRLLIAGGTPVPLTSKAFDTLVVLIENGDRVVTKDELLRSVWPDVQVEEGNLTQQIFLLRKALGETAQRPRYIVTVPGHGYRFTAPVEATSADPAPSGVSMGGAESPRTARSPGSRLVATGLVVFGIVGMLAMVLGWSRLAQDKASPRRDWTNPRITKVTESGRATYAAISPDGRYLAYVENDGDEYSLWVKQLAKEGKTLVVPRQPLVLTSLTFSPDGDAIYFTRGSPTHGSFVLSRIPTNGGLVTPILEDVDSPISFSPDGREFVFMRGASPETHIVVAAAGGGSQRILATRTSPLAFSFFAPDWSPDGKTVAASVVDESNGLRSSIVLLPVDGSNSRALYTSTGRHGRVRWLPDGSGLLTVTPEDTLPEWPRQFSRLTGGRIWRIGYPDGRAEPLTSDLTDYDPCCLDIGANGSAVAAVVNSLVSDLWIASADHLDTARQITSDHPVVSRHGWLPDNDTMVYRDLRGRLGAVTKDGRAFSLPLPDGHQVVGGVSACGDGGHVVFQAVPGNNIWRVTPNAGGPVKLTSGPFDVNPACSPDGKSVVYASNGSQQSSLWRISIDGGEPTPFIQGEGFEALLSPKGRMIYYWTWEWTEQPVRARQGRWVVITASDRTRLIGFDVPAAATIGIVPAWAPDESGLDYVVTRQGVSNVWRLPLGGGPPVQVTRLSAGKIFSFAWSPDGRWLSLASGVNRSDVVLMSDER